MNRGTGDRGDRVKNDRRVALTPRDWIQAFGVGEKKHPRSPEPFRCPRVMPTTGNKDWGKCQVHAVETVLPPDLPAPCPPVSPAPGTQNADPQERIGAYPILHSLPTISAPGFPRMPRRTGTRISLPTDPEPALPSEGNRRLWMVYTKLMDVDRLPGRSAHSAGPCSVPCRVGATPVAASPPRVAAGAAAPCCR